MDIYLKKAIEMYPNAGCELVYHTPFEFLSSVMLSAQTTDKKVNNVCETLYKRYPDYNCVKESDYDDIYTILKPLGLAKGKTKNFIELSKALKKMGYIPSTVEELIKLPGIGIKTAYVYMAEIHKEPHIAVDTHVFRVVKRLGLTNEDNPIKVSIDLEKRYKKEEYIKAHHSFLFLGRYKCKGNNPDCATCLLSDVCKYKKEA